MSSVPEARVVRDRMRLGAPPRRVPLVLWLRMMTGGSTLQTIWWTLAAIFVPLVALYGSFVEEGKALLPPIVASATFGLLSPIWFLFIRKRLRELRLLKYGIETRARLVGQRVVGSGKATRFEYDFRYEVSPGVSREVTIDVGFATTELEDDATESLVYDPSGVLPATTLDHLPGSPQIDEHGHLRARSSLFLLAIAGPVMTLGSIVVLWMLYGQAR